MLPQLFDFPSIRNAPGSIHPFKLPGAAYDDSASSSGATELPASEYLKRMTEDAKADEAFRKAHDNVSKAEKKRDEARKKRLAALSALGQVMPAQTEEARGLSGKEAAISGGLAILGRLFGGERAMPGIQSGLRSYVQNTLAKRKEAAAVANQNAQLRAQMLGKNAEIEARMAELPYEEAQDDLDYARKSLESELAGGRKEDIEKMRLDQKTESAKVRISSQLQMDPEAAITQATMEWRTGSFGPPDSAQARDTWASITSAIRTGNPNTPADTAGRTEERAKLLPGKIGKQDAEIKALGSLSDQRRKDIELKAQKIEESKARIRAGFARPSSGGGGGGRSGGGGGKSAGTGGKPVTMNQINQHRIALESYDKSLEEAEVALDMKLSENALDVQALYDMVNIKNERKKVAKDLASLIGAAAPLRPKAPAPK